MVRLATWFLLGFVPLALPSTPTWGQEGPEGQPAGKTAPSFTDDDLARYRERRLREEAEAGEVEIPPTPSPPSTAAPPAEEPGPPGGGASVVLVDLNRTLPRSYRQTAEATGRELVRFFQVPTGTSLEIPLRYFPDAESYEEYLGRNVPGDVMWTGYFDPLEGEIVVGGGPEDLAVLVHEMNHFIVHRVFDEVPVWFNEGLAEYFEGARTGSEGLVVADRGHHRRRLARWLESDRQPDLRQLLAPAGWTSVAPGFEHERLVRALSWSVVDFMMARQEGRDTLQAFMRRLKEQRGLHSMVALDRTFPGGVAAFERQWLDHVQGLAREQ